MVSGASGAPSDPGYSPPRSLLRYGLLSFRNQQSVQYDNLLAGLRFQVMRLGCVCKLFNKIANECCAFQFAHLATSSDAFLRKFTSLTVLTVHESERITNQGLSLLTNLKVLKFKGRQREFSCASLTRLESLSCGYLARVTPNQFLHLTKLTCHTSISSCSPFLLPSPFLAFTRLKKLKVDTCYPSEWHHLEALLDTCTDLTSLTFEHGYLPTEVSYLTRLQKLSCILDRRSIENLLALTNITSLDMKIDSSVTIAEVTRFTHLLGLNLNSCSDSVEALSKLTQLHFLDCGRSKISGRTLRHLRQLTRIDRLNAFNQINGKDIPTSIREMSLYCPVSSVSRLTNLQSLSVATPFLPRGLSCLTSLTNLETSWSTRIEENEIVALSNLTCLEVKSISDEALKSFPKLTRVVRLRKNVIPCDLDILEEVVSDLWRLYS